MNYIKKSHMSNTKPKYTTIFSDDEEEDCTSPTSTSLPIVIPALQTHRASFPPHFIDPMQTSPSYHIHQAEMALFTLKSAVLDDDPGPWKKVLVHKKSGVVIHMKSEKAQPMFKGEMVFQGFTPHSIFYVIGMRKLWDVLYEDGNLVENLNDTTSLTYEVCQPTSAAKSRRDLCLVEKIECTHNGTILFACTSAETPKVPRLQGRTRAQIKLMGWVLEPLSSGAIPLTKVSFVIQEPTKGWMTSLTKKSLARRPLIVLSSVHNYLKAKDQRIFEQKWCGPIRKRPSVLTPSQNSSSLFHSQRTLSSHIDPTKSINSISSNNKNVRANEGNGDGNEHEHPPCPAPTMKQPLYSPHRHLAIRNESVHLLKQLYLSPLSEWQLNSTAHNTHLYTKEHGGHVYSRLDGILQGDWLPEQICSLILSVHTRKHWDSWWRRGSIIERFSQRDYLMHWILATGTTLQQQDMAVVTHIDSEHGGRRIFMTSKSIHDDKVPLQDGLQRIAMSLYGWIVTLKAPSELEISFIVDMSLPWAQSQRTCLSNLHTYLNHHGLPPYIRRVSGKIVMEQFDTATATFQVAWIVRHQQPPNAAMEWCTDIRLDPALYRHGYNVDVSPTQEGTRIDRNRRTVKVFTTDPRMEGCRVYVKITPCPPPPPMIRTSHSLQNLGSRMIASYTSVHDISAIHRKPPVLQPPSNNSDHVAKGYILVPQPSSTQPPLLNFTDDLTFNGQQLMVVLFGMVMSYYLGKLANTC